MANTTYDPFGQTPISLLPEEEEEQQQTQTSAAPPPPPAPEPTPPITGGPNDVANQDLEERVPNPVSRLVIKPEAISEKPPAGPERAPDPFYKADDQRIIDFWRHPDPLEDEFQEKNIAAANFYFGPKTEDNPKGEYGFPNADLTPLQKKKLMFIYDGYGVPITTEDGSVLQQDGRYARLDLYPKKDREQMTTPQVPRGALPQIRQMGREALFAPTGEYGNLQKIDQGLQEIGLSDNARTFYLRMYASREFDADTLLKAGRDLAATVLSIPAYAQDLTTFLHKDVFIPGWAALFGSYGGYKTDEEVEAYRQTVADRPQIIDYEIPDYVSLKAQEYDVLPSVLETMFHPRGAALRAGTLGIEELSLYGPLAAGKVAIALKRAPLFDNYLKETYEVDNYIDAFKVMEERGESFTTVTQNFLDANVGERYHEAFRQSMDLVFGLRVMRPGTEERTVLLQSSMDNVMTQLSNAQKDLDSALRATNNDMNSGAVKRAKARIKSLHKQRNNIEGEVLLPKYLSDVAREMKGTVVGVTAATTVMQDFFGMDDKYQPLVEFGTVLTLAFKPSTGTLAKEGMRNILRDVTSVYTDYIRKGFSWQEFMKARDSHKLSRDARVALDELNKLPTELRASFFAGIEEASIMRRELIDLSAKTGVEIDADAFIENIAILSDVGSLVTLSRNIRDKITLDGFDKIQGELAHKEEVMNAQTMLITQMANATKKLLDLRIVGDLDETSAVWQLGEMMQRYTALTAEQLAKDEQGLKLLINNTGKNLTHVIMSGATQDKDSLPALTKAAEVLDLGARAGYLEVSQRAIDGVDINPTEALQEAARHMDGLQREVDTIMDDLVRSLNPEDAAAGSSSSYYTMALAARKFAIKKEVDEGYANFDTQYPNARANISSMFDVLFDENNIAELNGYATEEILKGTLKFAGKQLPAGMRKGFGAIFNDGAKEGIERIIKDNEMGIGQVQYDNLVELMGVGRQNYIAQIQKLKGAMDDLSPEGEPLRNALLDLFDGDDEMARQFGDAIPILISTADWRLVNKTLHKAAGNNESKRSLYKSIITRWEDAGKNKITRMNEDGTPMMQDGQPVQDENPMAFRTGWFDTGEPSLMGDEIYTEFRRLQDFYRVEYADRFYYDKTVRRLNNLLTRPRAEAAEKSIADSDNLDEWNIAEFRTQFQNAEFSPTQTLDELYGSILNSKATPAKERLLDEVEDPIAKSVGVYDPKTKRYYIVVEDEMEADSSVAKLGKNTQVIFTRWLQGKLATSKAGLQAQRRKGKEALYEPGAEFEYNRAGFEAFANVQVYRRDKDGNFVPAGTLVDREQAYSANTITALESNRADLESTFDNAYDVIENSWKARATGELEDYKRHVNAEIDFIKDVKRQFNLGAESGLSDVDAASEAVFTAVTRSDMIVDPNSTTMTLDRIKNILSQKAQDYNIPASEIPDFIDNTIKNMTIRHLYNSVSSVSGTVLARTEGGDMVKIPSIGMDGRKLLEQIGVDNPDVAGRLKTLIGADNYNSIYNIGRVLQRMQQERVSGIDGRIPSISLDSVLSRIYNINRQVVSTQWVATELLIRASKMHGGKLFQAMLSDPKVAKEVLEIIETGKIPKIQRESNITRMLSIEIVRQEIFNDAASSELTSGLYTGLTGVEIVEPAPTPAVRTPGTPFGTQTGTLPQPPEENVLDDEPTPPQLTPLQQQMRRLGRNPLN